MREFLYYCDGLLVTKNYTLLTSLPAAEFRTSDDNLALPGLIDAYRTDKDAICAFLAFIGIYDDLDGRSLFRLFWNILPDFIKINNQIPDDFKLWMGLYDHLLFRYLPTG